MLAGDRWRQGLRDNKIVEKLSLVQEIMIWAIPVLFAVTVHEVSHGWVAMLLGDKTALMLGRLTLNPFVHIDMLGTVVVPIVCLALGGFVFGWAKPVPVDWRNLKKPRRDTALVALAGPISNFLMAILWALVAKFGAEMYQGGVQSTIFLAYMGHAGIIINLVLMVLNLIPIPPLDGSRVVSSLLPTKAAMVYERIEPYGFFILVGLLLLNILPMILNPPIMILRGLIMGVFGI